MSDQEPGLARKVKVSGEGVCESHAIIFKPSIKIASKLLLLCAGLEAVGISSLSQQLLVKSEVLDFFFFLVPLMLLGKSCMSSHYRQFPRPVTQNSAHNFQGFVDGLKQCSVPQVKSPCSA